MMDELKELVRELKHPALLVALGAMIVTAVLLCNIKLSVEPIPLRPLVQVDYCLISYRAQAVDQYGLPHIVWTKGFGPCSQLDRYENA